MNSINRRLRSVALGVLVLLVALVVLWWFASSYTSFGSSTLRLGGGVFTARFADTREERIQGLSGTESLPADEALIFVYDRDDIWKIWMKDMRYAIDIVWLDESKTIVDIVEDATPESYPTEFAPDRDARYVIELASGTVKERSIRVGQTAEFDVPRRAT